MVVIRIARGVAGASPNAILDNQNNDFNAFFQDIDGIVVPADPAAGHRRLFVDTADGILKVRTPASTTVSLEAGAAGGEANTSSNSGAGDGLALAKVGVDLPFKSLIDDTEIVITSNPSDLTFSIAAAIARLATVQTWTARQTFEDNGIRIQNPAATFTYDIIASAIVANRTITLPLLTSNITLGDRAQSVIIAASDETTDLTTGVDKVKFRMPFAFTLTEVRASLSTAATGATLLTVDINESGATILSTKITIDASETTSTTAATAPVISDSALADDSEITIDIDLVGNTTTGRGLKVELIGHKTP